MLIETLRCILFNQGIAHTMNITQNVQYWSARFCHISFFLNSFSSIRIELKNVYSF